MMPIGVGNEISRCIGWSSAFEENTLNKHLQRVSRGEIIKVDRWKIETTTNSDAEPSTNSMFCFFSLGFDALITHNFHLKRQRDPSKCNSRKINKLWYTWFGISELLSPSDSVQRYISLKVDGIDITLPPQIRTLQILNIQSSADGIDFFGSSQKSSSRELQHYVRPALNDGFLEVVGTEGVIHLLRTRAKLSHSHRIAQGKDIQINVHVNVPVQLDGEPWIQKQGSIRITFADQIDMIKGFGKTVGIVPAQEPKAEPRLSRDSLNVISLD